VGLLTGYFRLCSTTYFNCQSKGFWSWSFFRPDICHFCCSTNIHKAQSQGTCIHCKEQYVQDFNCMSVWCCSWWCSSRSEVSLGCIHVSHCYQKTRSNSKSWWLHSVPHCRPWTSIQLFLPGNQSDLLSYLCECVTWPKITVLHMNCFVFDIVFNLPF